MRGSATTYVVMLRKSTIIGGVAMFCYIEHPKYKGDEGSEWRKPKGLEDRMLLCTLSLPCSASLERGTRRWVSNHWRFQEKKHVHWKTASDQEKHSRYVLLPHILRWGRWGFQMCPPVAALRLVLSTSRQRSSMKQRVFGCQKWLNSSRVDHRSWPVFLSILSPWPLNCIKHPPWTMV